MRNELSQYIVGSNEQPDIIIRPPGGWFPLNLKELWSYRELLYFLAWRDMKVRYKQTVFGAAWAVLQPFLTMVLFSVIFGRFIQVPSDGVPYPIFSYTALVPWTFFATSLSRSSGSLVYDANLISRVYFPRLIIPVAPVLAMLVDFGIAFLILLAMMVVYGILPGIAVLTLPFFLFLSLLAALGAGLWLATLNLKYRDVGYVIPFLIQLWLFATPVAYPSSVIPERWRLLFGLNPMAAVVEGFRWALLGTSRPTAELLITSTMVAILLFVTGLLYFRRMEYEFADVV